MLVPVFILNKQTKNWASKMTKITLSCLDCCKHMESITWLAYLFSSQLQVWGFCACVFSWYQILITVQFNQFIPTFSLPAPKETQRVPSKPKTSPKPYIPQAKDGKLLCDFFSSTVYFGLKCIYEQLLNYLSQLNIMGFCFVMFCYVQQFSCSFQEQ